MRGPGIPGIQEKHILKAIVDFLEGNRIPYIRVHPIRLVTRKGITFPGTIKDSQKGAPDLFVFPPRFYFRVGFMTIETKKPGGKQSDDQKKWQAWVNEAGGVYYLVENLALVDEFIKLFDKGRR